MCVGPGHELRHLVVALQLVPGLVAGEVQHVHGPGVESQAAGRHEEESMDHARRSQQPTCGRNVVALEKPEEVEEIMEEAAEEEGMR